MFAIDRLFERMESSGGSDLHLVAGQLPAMRTSGAFSALEGAELIASATLQAMMKEIVGATRWRAFIETRDIEFTYDSEDAGRFRVNYFVQAGGPAAIFRHIPRTLGSVEELMLPDVVASLADLERGLVLVSGPTGGGKSTTLAAIVERINANHRRHIITVEDPIEYVHVSGQSAVCQREVGTNTVSFAAALKAAVHQDADVVMISELRDAETMRHVFEAAAAGLLVLCAVPAVGVGRALERVVQFFASERQSGARSALADTMVAVTSQVLVPKKEGGSALAMEVLLQKSGLPEIIREGNNAAITSVIDASAALGMQSLPSALAALVERGEVDEAVARGVADGWL